MARRKNTAEAFEVLYQIARERAAESAKDADTGGSATGAPDTTEGPSMDGLRASLPTQAGDAVVRPSRSLLAASESVFPRARGARAAYDHESDVGDNNVRPRGRSQRGRAPGADARRVAVDETRAEVDSLPEFGFERGERADRLDAPRPLGPGGPLTSADSTTRFGGSMEGRSVEGNQSTRKGRMWYRLAGPTPDRTADNASEALVDSPSKRPATPTSPPVDRSPREPAAFSARDADPFARNRVGDRFRIDEVRSAETLSDESVRKSEIPQAVSALVGESGTYDAELENAVDRQPGDRAAVGRENREHESGDCDSVVPASEVPTGALSRETSARGSIKETRRSRAHSKSSSPTQPHCSTAESTSRCSLPNASARGSSAAVKPEFNEERESTGEPREPSRQSGKSSSASRATSKSTKRRRSRSVPKAKDATESSTRPARKKAKGRKTSRVPAAVVPSPVPVPAPVEFASESPEEPAATVVSAQYAESPPAVRDALERPEVVDEGRGAQALIPSGTVSTRVAPPATWLSTTWVPAIRHWGGWIVGDGSTRVLQRRQEVPVGVLGGGLAFALILCGLCFVYGRVVERRSFEEELEAFPSFADRRLGSELTAQQTVSPVGTPLYLQSSQLTRSEVKMNRLHATAQNPSPAPQSSLPSGQWPSRLQPLLSDSVGSERVRSDSLRSEEAGRGESPGSALTREVDPSESPENSAEESQRPSVPAWYVRVRSQCSLAEAEGVQRYFDTLGYPSHVKANDDGRRGRLLYSIFVSQPFRDKREADATCDRIKRDALRRPYKKRYMNNFHNALPVWRSF